MPNPNSIELSTIQGPLHPEIFRTDSGDPARFDLVVGLTLPDGTRVDNARHSKRQGQNFCGKDEALDGISLPPERGIRLAKAFQALREGHTTQCHSFVAEVFDVDARHIGEMYEPSLGDSVDRPLSGVPYAVLAQRPGAEGMELTHSAMGTDSSRLLSVLGYGSMLGVLSLEDTLSLHNYNNGAGAVLTGYKFPDK